MTSYARRSRSHFPTPDGRRSTGEIADILVEQRAPAAEVVHHLARCEPQDGDLLARRCQRAGGDAMRSLAYAEARPCTSGLSMHPISRTRVRSPKAHVELAEALQLSGQSVEARMASLRATELALDAANAPLIARASLEVAATGVAPMKGTWDATFIRMLERATELPDLEPASKAIVVRTRTSGCSG